MSDEPGDGHSICRERASRVLAEAARLGLERTSPAGEATPFVAYAILLTLVALAPRLPLALAIACLIPAAFANVVLAFVGHDAAHAAYSRHPRFNSAVGIWTLAHSFTTFEGFRLLHAAHHRHTGFDDDPTGDSPRRLEAVNLFTYCLFVLLPLGFPLFVILPSWLGGFGFQPHVFPASQRGRIRLNVLLVLIYQALYLSAVRVIGGPGGPAFAMAAFVAGLWVTTMMNAQAHAAVETYTECRFCNTRTIRTGPLLGLLTANGGYHVEHHLLPQIPWYRLEHVHRLIAREGGSRFVDPGYAHLHAGLLRRYAARTLGPSSGNVSPPPARTT